MPYNGDTTDLEPLYVHDVGAERAAEEPAHDTVTLMPNSSIQFLVNGIVREVAGGISRRFFEDNGAVDSGEGPILYSVNLDSDGTFHHPVTQAIADSRHTYAIEGSVALDAFLDRWIPLPFMRLMDGDAGSALLAEGPSNWVRAFITRADTGDESELSHRIVLAIDTTCCPKPRGRGTALAAPSIEDAQDGGLFRFNDDEEDIAWFVTEAWVDDWVRDVFEERANPQDADRAAPGIRQPSPLEYLGHYLTALAVLKECRIVPDIRLKGLGRNQAEAEFVCVDLVLDVGNSRTCAVLSEIVRSAAPQSVRTSSVLPLRDIDQPWRTYAALFSSRIEFSRASFGNESYSRWSGRTNAFFWPSLVRVGIEAQKLATQNHTSTDAAGLSGPMRYLWDDQPAGRPWRFSHTLDSAPRRRALVSGPLMGFISDYGDVLTGGERAGPATKPRFSRSSLLTFFGNEVILQAIVAINSPAYRAPTVKPDAPRRLERIIITVPAGMHPRERQIVLQRMQAAAKLTWAGLGWAVQPGSPPLPSVSLVEDNATNAQTAYLHNEIECKFGGKASEYFDLIGKARPGHRAARTIRVASLDIGGGSTGLSVANYELQQSKGIIRQHLAVDGFSIGGDDILKRIVECHLVPAIERALSDSKLGKPRRFLEDIMGGAANGRPSWIAEFGRRFAAEFSLPVALALLKECREPRAAGDDIVVTRTFRNLLEGTLHIPKAVIEEFDELAADEGADSFALLDAGVELRHRDLKQTIGSVLDQVLANCVRIIEACDCDLVLLSGWTGCLPQVLDALLGRLATQPNRIVQMQGMRVQPWYPCMDETGTKIGDAKSAAVAGALLSSAPSSKDANKEFVIIPAAAGPECRRYFVGRMGADGLVKNESVMFVFDDASQQGTVKEPGGSQSTIKTELPAILGVRRLAHERWPAAPLFVIDVGDIDAADRPKMPVEVTLERFCPGQGQPEDLRIVKARDGYGNSLPPSDLELRLQTLPTRSGHWCDTGAIVIA